MERMAMVLPSYLKKFILLFLFVNIKIAHVFGTDLATKSVLRAKNLQGKTQLVTNEKNAHRSSQAVEKAIHGREEIKYLHASIPLDFKYVTSRIELVSEIETFETAIKQFLEKSLESSPLDIIHLHVFIDSIEYSKEEDVDDNNDLLILSSKNSIVAEIYESPRVSLTSTTFQMLLEQIFSDSIDIFFSYLKSEQYGMPEYFKHIVQVNSFTAIPSDDPPASHHQVSVPNGSLSVTSYVLTLIAVSFTTSLIYFLVLNCRGKSKLDILPSTMRCVLSRIPRLKLSDYSQNKPTKNTDDKNLDAVTEIIEDEASVNDGFSLVDGMNKRRAETNRMNLEMSSRSNDNDTESLLSLDKKDIFQVPMQPTTINKNKNESEAHQSYNDSCDTFSFLGNCLDKTFGEENSISTMNNKRNQTEVKASNGTQQLNPFDDAYYPDNHNNPGIKNKQDKNNPFDFPPSIGGHPEDDDVSCLTLDTIMKQQHEKRESPWHRPNNLSSTSNDFYNSAHHLPSCIEETASENGTSVHSSSTSSRSSSSSSSSRSRSTTSSYSTNHSDASSSCSSQSLSMHSRGQISVHTVDSNSTSGEVVFQQQQQKSFNPFDTPAMVSGDADTDTVLTADIKRNCYAPPGNLGLVVGSSYNGENVVQNIDKGSPLEGILFVGDKIIAVDNIDVRQMSANAVTDLLVQYSNMRRKITFINGFQ